MKTDTKTIKAAKKMALKDKTLAIALKEWFRLESNSKAFSEWMDKRSAEAAEQIEWGRRKPVTAEDIVRALRVNAEGDSLTLFLASAIAKDGYNTDVNCYVEEGVVYVNLWIGGKAGFQNKERAEHVVKLYRKRGFAADIFLDDEDGGCTACGWVKFSRYMGR